MFLFNAFGVAHGGVAAVLHRSVAADIADGGVAAVLHGAVIADITDSGVVAVVHCAVIHVGCGCVVAVLYGLCRYVCGDGKQECQCQKFGEGFHNRRFLGSTLSFVCIAKIRFLYSAAKGFFINPIGICLI